MNDDAKRKILARRAQFIAAALAGVSCGKEPASQPQPCLSVVYVGDAGPNPPPADDTTATTATADNPPDAGPAPFMPCLSTVAPENRPDAGYAPPLPCLAPMPPNPKPTPAVCLRVALPDEGK